jgi:hypothetical protein
VSGFLLTPVKAFKNPIAWTFDRLQSKGLNSYVSKLGMTLGASLTLIWPSLITKF